MRREPVIFAVAGIIFGFVLGYMAASRSAAPGPSRPITVMPAAPGAAAGPGAAPAAGMPVTDHELDSNEVQALESLAARDKTSLDARVELGNLLMDHSRYLEAARWYREALALDPRLPDVLVDLGACLVNAGQPREGLAEFERALEQDPDHKKALFNKGVALMQSGRAQQAVAVWEDLLRRFPDDPLLQGLRTQIEQVRSSAGSAP